MIMRDMVSVEERLKGNANKQNEEGQLGDMINGWTILGESLKKLELENELELGLMAKDLGGSAKKNEQLVGISPSWIFRFRWKV